MAEPLKTSFWGSLGRGALDTVTVGNGAETRAYVRSMLPGSKSYDDLLKETEAQDKLDVKEQWIGRRVGNALPVVVGVGAVYTLGANAVAAAVAKAAAAAAAAAPGAAAVSPSATPGIIGTMGVGLLEAGKLAGAGLLYAGQGLLYPILNPITAAKTVLSAVVPAALVGTAAQFIKPVREFVRNVTGHSPAEWGGKAFELIKDGLISGAEDAAPVVTEAIKTRPVTPIEAAKAIEDAAAIAASNNAAAAAGATPPVAAPASPAAAPSAPAAKTTTPTGPVASLPPSSVVPSPVNTQIELAHSINGRKLTIERGKSTVTLTSNNMIKSVKLPGESEYRALGGTPTNSFQFDIREFDKGGSIRFMEADPTGVRIDGIPGALTPSDKSLIEAKRASGLMPAVPVAPPAAPPAVKKTEGGQQTPGDTKADTAQADTVTAKPVKVAAARSLNTSM